MCGLWCRTSIYTRSHSQKSPKPTYFTYLLDALVATVIAMSSNVNGSERSALLRIRLCHVDRLLGAVVRHLAHSDILFCRVVYDCHISSTGWSRTLQRGGLGLSFTLYTDTRLRCFQTLLTWCTHIHSVQRPTL